jgi:hypothetical protein
VTPLSIGLAARRDKMVELVEMMLTADSLRLTAYGREIE